jgi:phthalate 4,5-cis-dihydrodiol dehydrogenase
LISDPIRLAVVGLGRGFMLSLPSIIADPHCQLVACSSGRGSSRKLFEDEFKGSAYSRIEDMLRDDSIEAVYVATPHEYHASHAVACAEAGKHILVDKPLSISLEDAQSIVDAAESNGVHLITGPSHSFDQSISCLEKLLADGQFGRVRMVNAINYTDFLYRPRRPEELDTNKGGGVIFSQAIHQVDVTRRIVKQPVESVYGRTGNWDPQRSTEGAFHAVLNFQDGAFASLTYSGYAHYDSDIQQKWISELGQLKDETTYGKSRQLLGNLSDPAVESSLKAERGYGATEVPDLAPYPEHFGPIIVSCDRADFRVYPDGIEIWADFERTFVPVAKDASPRSEVFSSMYSAIRFNNPPLQSGRWGMDSLSICHAILESEKLNRPIPMNKYNYGESNV